jgi:tetratricopeptide (TPR) repeat protein
MFTIKAKRSRRPVRRRPKQFLLGRLYLGLPSQYATTIISAILLSAFVFSGFLLFRYSDTHDLLNRGRKQMAQGKVAWAAKTLETLVNHHPDHYDGLLLLGQAYLQLGERKKAEQAFMAASLLQSKAGMDSKDPNAGLALGKLAMARKQYADAEKQFLQMAKLHPKNAEVRKALFNLYHDWANRLLEDKKPLDQPLSKFEKAWEYVSDYDEQDQLKSAWLATMRQYVEDQVKQKHFDNAIRMLERVLKVNYDPEMQVQLASTYERKGDLNNAIAGYRKAFTSNPPIIGMKLSSLLVKKGEQLAKAGKADEAAALFAEAKQVSNTASIPLDTIYPIKLSQVKLSYDNNLDTDEVHPELHVTFANGAKNKPLPFLAARVQFFANDQLLGEVRQPVATAEDPLQENKQAPKTLVFRPTESLNLYQLEGKPLIARLSVAYNDGDKPSWKQLLAEEVVVHRSRPPVVQDGSGWKNPMEPPVGIPDVQNLPNPPQ